MIVVVSVLMTGLAAQVELKPGERIVPIIEGPWWQVAGQPDLGELTSEKQQPVDFCVWQAADGTWQLWSCIRHTKCGGHTRLFHRWEGKRLTDANWQPMGIAMQAKPELGESPGGLQAPHVVKHDRAYWMAYGDWVNICFATSTDGKTFTRVIQPNGKTGAFTEGAGANTRDPMLIKIDGVWHCYYTAFPGRQGFAFCRTSPDLRRWSHSCVVSYGGKIGTSPFHIECPHVVEVFPGEFVFFRNQSYGQGQRNWVYHSRNPLNFGINDDSKLVCSLPVAAPEIVLHEGKYYIAALNPGLDGIRIARLKWAKVARLGKPVFDFDDAKGRAEWRLIEGNLEGVFTTSTRKGFNSRTRHFIGTAETKTGRLNDRMTGVIKSPEFVLERDAYVLLVSGGSDKNKAYIAVIDSADGSELARYGGKNDNALEAKTFEAKVNKGRRVRVRIVDWDTGEWGHVNFGGIFTAPSPVIIR